MQVLGYIATDRVHAVWGITDKGWSNKGLFQD